MNNPFQLVYDGLWTMVERNPRLSAKIPLGNRIKFEENADKLQNPVDADVPELALISAGFTKNNQSTDCTSMFTKKYMWALTTGTLIISEYNEISWELLRSMEHWKDILCTLTWCDCPFVNYFRILEVQEGNEMLTKESGIDGWSAFCTVEVDLQFSVSKLKLS